jgi:acetyl esterase/lipase
MAAALGLMASERGDVRFVQRSMYYPVTDAAMGHRLLRPVRGGLLQALPPALVIVDEADVLRDEGEAYAGRLRAAGVEVTTVRYDGITHDFMMLAPLSGTHATRAAVAQAIADLRQALHEA